MEMWSNIFIVFLPLWLIRKGHATQHAILDIVNTIQSNVNQGLFSCGVFMDLKEAFDTIHHNILLDQLNPYGFRGTITGKTGSLSIWIIIRNRLRSDSKYQSNPMQDVVLPKDLYLALCFFYCMFMTDIKCSNNLRFYLFEDDGNILYAEKNW